MVSVFLPVDCGGVVEVKRDQTIRIQSPGFPGKLSPGLKCYWLIQVSPCLYSVTNENI